MLIGFGDELPDFSKRIPALPETELHSLKNGRRPVWTALQLARAGWLLHMDLDGCRVLSPQWETIEPDDVLFIDKDGLEVSDENPDGFMIFGITLYKILAE